MTENSWRFLTVTGLAASLLLASGARAEETEKPLSFGASNVLDVLSNASGGLKTGVRVLEKFGANARFTGDAQSLPGVTAFLDLQWTDATGFSDTLVGDMQHVSNIDGPAGARIVNAWVAREFEGEGAVKAGIVDLNSEFDVQAIGGLFLDSSHGIGPDFSQSGSNGPSVFPSTGLGLTGWWIPGGHWQLKAGVFEGTPGDPDDPGHPSYALSAREGALIMFEARNRPTPDIVLGAGLWHYTARFPAIEGDRDIAGNTGIYALVESPLFNHVPGDRQGLHGWLRFGYADARLNAVEVYAGGGLVYNGIGMRDADQVGLVIAHARLGSQARRAAGSVTADGETTIELTYSFALAGTLTLQPDLQYVIAPGANRAVPNALVIGTRIVLSWP